MSNSHETLGNLLPHEVIIFTKFHEDWTKIVDFYQWSIFECVRFFLTQTLPKSNVLNSFLTFQDLEYWDVDELYLEQCCVQRYYQQRELLTWDHQVKKEEELEIFQSGRLGRLQKILWDLFEKPHTSVGARVRISK